VQVQDSTSGNFGEGCGERGGFKAAVHRVARLGVTALKVE
jgi:hypothetical protein